MSSQLSLETSNSAIAHISKSTDTAEKGTALNEFDWDTDIINPLNWPKWKRAYHAILPAVFGFVV